MEIEVREIDGGAGAVCAAILELLPTWFGIPASNADYVATADNHPGVIATIDGEAVGITTVKRHSEWAAEISLMAVRPERHRHGIGRLMLQAAERRMAAERVEFLQVKTLSAADPDPGYAKTRAFWFAVGFRPLEEFPLLWGPDSQAVQMIKTVSQAAPG